VQERGGFGGDQIQKGDDIAHRGLSFAGFEN